MPFEFEFSKVGLLVPAATVARRISSKIGVVNSADCYYANERFEGAGNKGLMCLTDPVLAGLCFHRETSVSVAYTRGSCEDDEGSYREEK